MAEKLIEALGIIEGLLWSDPVLYAILAVGVLFTLWSVFGQYRAITHGVQVVRGKYDDKDDPGAINHFQALSAALSATVGLGNIGGVALAISLGGPGAVFWMWVVGFFGMALKMTEVTMALIYRNTDDPDNPHGGSMWVCEKGFKELYPSCARFGSFLGGLFVVTLLISAVTGGNMFQAWNVGAITQTYFNVPSPVSGVILAIVVGLVIIGGIKRIGAVAGRLVPGMCILYFSAAILVLVMQIDQIPSLLALIVKSAFSPLEAQGAFVGGTAAYAFMWGMKRALFSNEAGQGSAPIAHCAAKTDEPVREGVVAGLEPLIDTIVVCTLTALVILSSGIWNRAQGEARMPMDAALIQTTPDSNEWIPNFSEPPALIDKDARWVNGDQIFVVLEGRRFEESGLNRHRLAGEIIVPTDDPETESIDESENVFINWTPYDHSIPEARQKKIDNLRKKLAAKPNAATQEKLDRELEWAETLPRFYDFEEERPGDVAQKGFPIFVDYQGAALTGKAFDRATGWDLGKWLVTIASWLFAISTMISWNYYGEQGVIYLFGDGAFTALLYKLIFCVLIVLATIPAVLKTDAQVGTLTGFGTGVMLLANIPIMLLFSRKTMRVYHDYMGKLKRGEMDPHEAPSITDVVEGKDVE